MSPLHERMHAVVGHVTYRALSDATGQNAETVRRYMQGQAPSAEFLAALCSRYDVSAQWLLTGDGPMKQSHARAHALREANPAELLSAVALALERLTLRVDRLEVFVQMVEARLRGIGSPADIARGGTPRPSLDHAHHPTRDTRDQPLPQAETPGGPARAKRLADAVAQRSRTDVG